MVVFVNKSMLIDGAASDVHFTDPLCFGLLTGNETIIRVAAPYKSCGTVHEVNNNQVCILCFMEVPRI